MAVLVFLVVGASGCGGGSDHTTTVTRTVTVPVRSPVGSLSLARRDPEATRTQPGHHPRSEAGCVEPRGGHVKTVYLRSEGETCVRVAPRDRLLFVDAIGGESGGIEVRAGPYQGYGKIGGSVLIPAPVGSYLAPGLHRVEAGADATKPLVLVLPEGCRVKDTRPGESLCFAAGAPPCHGSELGYRTPMGGAGAGTYYQQIEVVNRSGRTCTVSGFPHVVPLDSRGRPVLPSIPTSGYTRTNSGNHRRRIALEPGAAAIFEINTGTAANYTPRSSCRPRKPATLRIHVPGSGDGTKSVPYGMELCTRRSNVDVGRIE